MKKEKRRKDVILPFLFLSGKGREEEGDLSYFPPFPLFITPRRGGGKEKEKKKKKEEDPALFFFFFFTPHDGRKRKGSNIRKHHNVYSSIYL